jgi:hypothetical protein
VKSIGTTGKAYEAVTPIRKVLESCAAIRLDRIKKAAAIRRS